MTATLTAPAASMALTAAPHIRPRSSRECICCGAEFPLVAATLVTCPDCRAAKRHRCLTCDAVFTPVGRERQCATCHPPFRPEVEAFLRYLEVERNAAPNTIIAYGRDLADVCRYLDQHAEGWTWETLTKATVRGFMGDCQRRGLGMRSIARATTALKRFYRYLRLDDAFPCAPLYGLRIPKYPRRLTPIFQPGETEAVFHHAERAAGCESFAEVRALCMLELFYGTGIRLSELVGIDLEDLDLNREQVSVIGKGNKQRIVPVGSKAMEVLARYLALREQRQRQWGRPTDTGPLFLASRGGKRIGPRQVQRLIRAAVRAAKVPGHRLHALRHTFATDMMNAGAGIREIQELLGHETIATTALYCHVAVEGLKRQYMKAHPRANWTEDRPDGEPGHP